MIWFGWVLWFISHCRLFNAKSNTCIWLVIKVFGKILNKPELIFLRTVEWFQEFLSDANNSIYCYQIQIILFDINHLFATQLFHLLLMLPVLFVHS